MNLSGLLLKRRRPRVMNAAPAALPGPRNVNPAAGDPPPSSNYEIFIPGFSANPGEGRAADASRLKKLR